MTAAVLEGSLQLGKNPQSTASKDWKTFLFVLKQDRDLKRSVLDYYKDVNKRWQKQERRGSIELWPFFQVSLAHACSYQYPLKITDSNKKEHFLAASSFELMTKWCNALQRQSYLVRSNQENYREFVVKAEQSVSTSLIGASGECILAFTPQKQMVCALLPSRQTVGVWPYNSLRNYWGGKDLFGFKAGRRSPRGEGEFVFLTTQGEEIYRYLERTVRLTSMVASMPRPELDDSLPPDPTRSETPVLSSESDEESKQPSPPHLPPKPPDLTKRLSLGPLPEIPLPEIPSRVPPNNMSGTEVSDTSPAYFTNKQTSSKLKKGPKHRIQASGRSQSLGAVLPPSQVPAKTPISSSHSYPHTANLVPEEDDTYSHATHELQRHRNPADGAVLYQGLVRTDSSRSTTKPNRRSITDQPSDEQMYDIAYLPNSQPIRMLAPVSEGEYGAVGDAEDQKKELMEKKLVPSDASVLTTGGKMLTGGNISFGAKLRQGMDTTDGREKPNKGGVARLKNEEILTDNPLYDSNENLLSPSFSVGGAGSIMEGAEKPSTANDSRRVDFTDDLVTNPVYGEHTPRGLAMGSNVDRQIVNRAMRAVSPLEHSMATNPLYGGQQDVLMMKRSYDAGEKPLQEITPKDNQVSEDKDCAATDVTPEDGRGPAISTGPANTNDDAQVVRENEVSSAEENSYSDEHSKSNSVITTECDVKNSDSHKIDTLDVKPSDERSSPSEASPSPSRGSPSRKSPSRGSPSRGSPIDVPSSKEHKGYSQVDKKKKKKENASSDKLDFEDDDADHSPPPPIPARNYSNDT